MAERRAESAGTLKARSVKRRGRPAGPGAGAGQVQSLTRALSLLERVSEHEQGATLTDLALAVELARQDRLGRNADHGDSRGDILENDRIGADPRFVADCDRPQDLRAGSDDDAVAERWVAFDADLRRAVDARRHAAQRHIMI